MSTVHTVNPPASELGRITRIVRLHFANPWTTIIMPWVILGIIFLANLAIWLIIFASVGPEDRADVSEGLQYSGASMFIFIYMMVVAIQAISVTFPFALGYGVTRRDYYLGSALTFVVLAAIFTVGLTVLSVIEEATGGWGVGGRMFTALYFGDGGWLQRAFIYFVSFLFFLFFGSAIAAVWVRWKSNGVVAFFVTLAFVLIGLAALVTFTESWPRVGEFFAVSGFLGSFAWTLVPTAIAAVAGFFILRRATPRAA
jgi:hypothetical protein